MGGERMSRHCHQPYEEIDDETRAWLEQFERQTVQRREAMFAEKEKIYESSTTRNKQSISNN